MVVFFNQFFGWGVDPLYIVCLEPVDVKAFIEFLGKRGALECE
jgi:hypothetical protein